MPRGGGTGRIILFLAAVFAGVALPFAVIGVAALTGPPPYVLTPGTIAPEWFAGRSGVDGTHIVVKRLADPDQAVRWAKSRLGQIDPGYRSTNFSGVSWYQGGDGANAGVILPVGALVVEITGPDTASVENALKSLDFVRENPAKGLAWVLRNHLGLVLAALLVYVIALALVLTRLASRAVTIPADPTATPVTEEELRRRLLAIDRQDVPFTVGRWKHGRLRVEWRLADARWTHLLQKKHVKRVERLTLALDARSRTLRVVESSVSVSGSVGPLAFMGALEGFMGIRFARIEFAKEYGLAYSLADGWRLDKAYEYRFSATELKAPVATATTANGWTWKPVVTLVRPVGG